MWVFRGIDPNITHELISTLKRLKLFSAFMFFQSIHAQTDLYHRETIHNDIKGFFQSWTILQFTLRNQEQGNAMETEMRTMRERALRRGRRKGIHNDVTSVVLTTGSCSTHNQHHDLEL